jgi:hypothetical protein
MHHSYILGVKNATGNGQTGKVSCCTLMHHSYMWKVALNIITLTHIYWVVKNATGDWQTGKVSCCTLMHHSYLLGVKNATGNGQAGKVSCCTLMHQSYLLGCFFYELNNTLR